ncbi:MSHA biogenesis protein MshK [Natronospira proteinivora]|uniref:MSHA biogenesis protein MshK n=1 Tax=Natronospira proteinivora TaxID=1807133 RepID=A0ABT1G9T8_9GAMM|nr:hypothetical protein [Natronospira proteinivora]MCP1728096.1 MSHA biogenesis protein MshK [Natronospira proteinivora]
MLGLSLLTPMAALAEVDDPMRPPAQSQQIAEPSPLSDWTLTSVLIAENRRLAVINGQVLRVGESVDGARLIRIDAGGVVIRHARGQETLSLSSNLGISRSSSQ